MERWTISIIANMADGAHMHIKDVLVDGSGARGRLPPSEPTLGPPQPAVRRQLCRAPR